MIIETIELLAADTLSLSAFYRERLGLPTTRNSATGELTITVGASQIVFQQTPGFTGIYHFAFNIPENRLANCRTFLKERGVSLIADANGNTVFDFDFWDAHTLYFYDPAGNIGECIARHELPNASPLPDAPFSSSEILNISEIALPCDDVSAVATEIQAVCGIATYRETSPAFFPLGDAHGLLILVLVGRAWFPDTGIPAHPYPLRVIVRNRHDGHFVLSWSAPNGYIIELQATVAAT